MPSVLDTGFEAARTLCHQLYLLNLWRVNQVDALNSHASKSDGNFQGGSPRVFALERENQSSMSHSLVAFKSLLESDIDDIS